MHTRNMFPTARPSSPYQQRTADDNSPRGSTKPTRPGISIWRNTPKKDDLKKVGVTKDGCVVFDRPNSHYHVDLMLLAEAISRVALHGKSFVTECVDFGRMIGTSDCVATVSGDDIVFAQRKGRAGLTRFVTNRTAEPCSSVVVVLKRREEDSHSYILITAFVGAVAEPEPWDKKATPASQAFWSNHALVFGSQPTLPETLTKICPW